MILKKDSVNAFVIQMGAKRICMGLILVWSATMYADAGLDLGTNPVAADSSPTLTSSGTVSTPSNYTPLASPNDNPTPVLSDSGSVTYTSLTSSSLSGSNNSSGGSGNLYDGGLGQPGTSCFSCSLPAIPAIYAKIGQSTGIMSNTYINAYQNYSGTQGIPGVLQQLGIDGGMQTTDPAQLAKLATLDGINRQSLASGGGFQISYGAPAGIDTSTMSSTQLLGNAHTIKIMAPASMLLSYAMDPRFVGQFDPSFNLGAFGSAGVMMIATDRVNTSPEKSLALVFPHEMFHAGLGEMEKNLVGQINAGANYNDPNWNNSKLYNVVVSIENDPVTQKFPGIFGSTQIVESDGNKYLSTMNEFLAYTSQPDGGMRYAELLQQEQGVSADEAQRILNAVNSDPSYQYVRSVLNSSAQAQLEYGQ